MDKPSGLKAWIGKRASDIRKRGSDAAPWILFWNEPNGRRREKSYGVGSRGEKAAMKAQEKIHAQLLTNTYDETQSKKWEEFREKYLESKGELAPPTRELVETVFDHFERIIKPGRVASIDSLTLDTFVAARRKETGRKAGSKLSPATINRDLRTLKAILSKAVRWGYLKQLPDFQFDRVPEKTPRFITPEHFEAMYRNCDAAAAPVAQGYTPGDWWRALLVTLTMTGWRIGETLALRWQEVDLETGIAKLRGKTTKGKREEILRLNPVVIEHIRKLAGFSHFVFTWPADKRRLYKAYHDIQTAAGIRLPCEEEHEHTDCCHMYGFHDNRRAFATINSSILAPEVLQRLMRHKSFSTTQGYVNMAKRVTAAAEAVHVPGFLKKAGGA